LKPEKWWHLYGDLSFLYFKAFMIINNFTFAPLFASAASFI